MRLHSIWSGPANAFLQHVRAKRRHPSVMLASPLPPGEWFHLRRLARSSRGYSLPHGRHPVCVLFIDGHRNIPSGTLIGRRATTWYRTYVAAPGCWHLRAAKWFDVDGHLLIPPRTGFSFSSDVSDESTDKPSFGAGGRDHVLRPISNSRKPDLSCSSWLEPAGSLKRAARKTQ
jgi:hypothetical protein